MKFFYYFLFLINATLLASDLEYRDDDLDGVVDIYDKCLATPFEYEVQSNGCPKEQQSEFYKYRVDFAYSYSKQNDTSYSYEYTAKELSLYLETNQYLLRVSNSYLNLEYNDISTNRLYDEQGYSDLLVEVGYKFNYEYLYSVNFISKFATASNSSLSSGKNDYTIELNFHKSYPNYYLFSYVSYSFIGDSEINYNNFFDGALGVMHSVYDDLYGAVNLYYSEPIIETSKEELDIQMSLSLVYDVNYQLSLTYATNLKDRESFDKNSINLKVSYFF